MGDADPARPPAPLASLTCQSTSPVGSFVRAESNDGRLNPMASNGNFQGREVVIVEAARPPIGRGHEQKGDYKDTHPSTPLATTYNARIDRARLDATEL